MGAHRPYRFGVLQRWSLRSSWKSLSLPGLPIPRTSLQQFTQSQSLAKSLPPACENARRMARYLDDIINIMQIQIRTRQDGGYLPFADTLPPAQDDEGDGL